MASEWQDYLVRGNKVWLFNSRYQGTILQVGFHEEYPTVWKTEYLFKFDLESMISSTQGRRCKLRCLNFPNNLNVNGDVILVARVEVSTKTFTDFIVVISEDRIDYENEVIYPEIISFSQILPKEYCYLDTFLPCNEGKTIYITSHSKGDEGALGPVFRIERSIDNGESRVDAFPVFSSEYFLSLPLIDLFTYGDGSVVGISLPFSQQGSLTNTGRVLLTQYNRDSKNLIQFQEILSDKPKPEEQFGTKGIFSSTGHLLIVSSPFSDHYTTADIVPSSGMVSVYQRSNGIYSFSQNLRNEDAETTNVNFGYSVGVSRDESVIAVGIRGLLEGHGSVRVYGKRDQRYEGGIYLVDSSTGNNSWGESKRTFHEPITMGVGCSVTIMENDGSLNYIVGAGLLTGYSSNSSVHAFVEDQNNGSSDDDEAEPLPTVSLSIT